jgi:hypothetical protein
LKVTGFTIIRNAIKFDFPVKEAISSVLPLCSNFVISVGKSEDDTLNFIKNINDDKINIIESIWDEKIKTGGKILSVETNKAKNLISKDIDWLIYIQADEVIHENDYNEIYKMMHSYKENENIDGLLFKYKHFYGSYDYVCNSTKWYRREIRIIKNKPNIYSFGDAQGFRKDNNEKLNVKLINASVYHYGWVRHPKTMQEKNDIFHQLWGEQKQIELENRLETDFDYSNIESLIRFTGTHPNVMKERINLRNWNFKYDEKKIKIDFIEKVRRFVEHHTDWRIGEYRNYKIIK